MCWIGYFGLETIDKHLFLVELLRFLCILATFVDMFGELAFVYKYEVEQPLCVCIGSFGKIIKFI